MKIIISLSNIQIGGAQIFALQLANELTKRQHQVVVYSYYPYYDKFQNIPLNIKIETFPKNKIIRFIIWKLNALLKRINLINDFETRLRFMMYKYFVQKFQPDIINSHMSQSDLVVSQLTQYVNFTFIPTLHGEYEMEIIPQNDIEFIYHKASAIIYTNPKNLSKISHLLNDNKKITQQIGVGYSDELIQNALEKSKKNNHKSLFSPSDFVFGMIARGIPEKGWEEAIQSFIQVHQQYPKSSLLLIGDGPYLKNIVEKYQHPKIILLQLEQNPYDFLAYIPCIHVGLLPTYFIGETFPNILVQYIYFNKPIIATDIGEIKNIICPNGQPCGKLLSLHNYRVDIHELTHAMIEILNPKVYEYYTQNIKNTKYLFDIKTIATQYEMLFQKVLKDKNMA